MQASRRIIPLHQIQAVWQAIPTFLPFRGEIVVYDPDEKNSQSRFKIGDGIHTVTQLPFTTNSMLTELFTITETGQIILDCGRITAERS